MSEDENEERFDDGYDTGLEEGIDQGNDEVMEWLKKELENLYPQVDPDSKEGKAYCNGYNNAIDDVMAILKEWGVRKNGV